MGREESRRLFNSMKNEEGKIRIEERKPL